ncbi:MAG: DUF433 domain-containing protein [Anaerolineae bacterium]|nr:DUF433 domain-containing protein [Anaerolineae bacterium]
MAQEMDYAPINFVVIIEGTARLATRTRLRIMDIAAMVRSGATPEWIVENHELSLAQVHAALAYYYDHQAEIDQELEADIEEFNRQAAESPNTLEKLRARLAAKSNPPTE